MDTTFSPLLPYGSYLLPWNPEFQSYLVQNLMQSIPQPNDASDKIWLRLAHWLRRYLSLKMFTHGRMDGRTDRRLIDRYTINPASIPCLTMLLRCIHDSTTVPLRLMKAAKQFIPVELRMLTNADASMNPYCASTIQAGSATTSSLYCIRDESR